MRHLPLRVAIAAALLTSAVIHLRLAPGYQLASSGGVGMGTMFRLEAAAAIGAALLVLARGNRRTYLVALVVAGGSFAAVMLYRYVDVPALGLIPAMYEPVFFPQKVLSALAEFAAAVLALVGLLMLAPSDRTVSPVCADVGGRV